MFQHWWRGRDNRARTASTTTPLGVERLEDRLVLSANLLADINQVTQSAFPAGTTITAAVQIGDYTYFSADDGEHANALWRTDGTAEGTVLIKAIGGADGATLAHLTKFGSKLLFTADDGARGDEVWISDGTAAGTRLLLDINKRPSGAAPNALPGSSNAADFVVAGGRAFFTAYDGTHGREVWATNGTRDGTIMIQDIDPTNSDPDAGGPTGLTRLGSQVFFWATDDEHGRELWATNGTKVGTYLVKDINFGAGDACPEPYYSPSGVNGHNMAVVNGVLYFGADNGKGGVELWSTDGETTSLLRNLYTGSSESGPNSSNPMWLTRVGDTLVFTAEHTNGRQLWSSDGTRDGTRLLAVVEPADAPAAEGPLQLTEYDGKLYFTARTIDGEEALWVSDGSAAGTLRLKIIAPPLDLDSPDPLALRLRPQRQQLFVASDVLYFTAVNEENGRELWTTDGTEEGTVLLKDIRPGQAGSEIAFLGVHLGRLLFAANDGATGRELWLSDGSADGTVLVKDINLKGSDGYPSKPVQAGDQVFFIADDGEHGAELWVSDGDGARLVRDINAGIWPGWGGGGDALPAGSNIRDLVAVGNRVFFVADDGEHGAELWVSNGTAAGTWMVKDITAEGGTSLDSLTALGERVFFVADDGVHGRELWVSDGDEEGTYLVKDVIGAAANAEATDAPFDDSSSNPADLVVLGDLIYFAATDAVHGRELWSSDGTAEGTALVRNINAEVVDSLGVSGPARDSNPMGLTRVGSYLFFAADNGRIGVELWRTDGTLSGTTRVHNINRVRNEATGGTLGSLPRSITAVGDEAFFVADDGVNGLALWKSDGTSAGTELVRAVGAKNRATQSITDLTAVGDQLYFVAYTQKAGKELWVSDGTKTGTHLVRDVFTGNFHVPPQTFLTPNDANPSHLTAFDGKVYFVANNGVRGRELWSSDGTVEGTRIVLDALPGEAGGLDGTSGLTATANALYFSADDGEHGVELWKFSAEIPVAETTEEAQEVPEEVPAEETPVAEEIVESGEPTVGVT